MWVDRVDEHACGVEFTCFAVRDFKDLTHGGVGMVNERDIWQLGS
jgi:hypothetical protein